MIKTDTEELFSALVEAVGEKLKPLGYMRRGLVFRIIANNNCGLIGFQRSVANSKDALSFTINLGVTCGELLDQTITQLKDVQIVDAHLSQRIGFLLPERCDKWWKINGDTDFQSLYNEVLELVSNIAAPYISKFLNTSAICSLWESGQSPGLTEFQCVQFLSKLKTKLIENP